MGVCQVTTIIHLDFPEDRTKALVTIEGHAEGGTIISDGELLPSGLPAWVAENEHGEVLTQYTTREKALKGLLDYLNVTGEYTIFQHHEYQD